MNTESRRQFLHDVGEGMLVAGAGAALVCDLGWSAAFADDGRKEPTLTFGKLEPLVCLMQETPVARLQSLLVAQLKNGETTLPELISAAALANARTFGGEDYVGYHCEMALTPALEMAFELPKPRQALPVLKVLYRNTAQLQQRGGRKHEALKPVHAVEKQSATGEHLRDAVRERQVGRAEEVFASLSRGDAKEAYNMLQYTVQDYANVHRVVLAHRSWQLVKLVGTEHAHTLLRQCVRFCVQQEQVVTQRGNDMSLRSLVPKALDQHRLLAVGFGNRQPDDKWISEFADTIYQATREQALEATAEAIAEGMSREAVAEALSLAANQLILRHDQDEWRGKFVHGNSTGVHAADAMNAWRHIARDCDQRHAVVSLLVGAYYVANDGLFKQEPYPHQEQVQTIKAADARELLHELDDAIRSNDQARASAVAHRYGELGHASRPIFQRLLNYAVSEDGHLHNEKYYRTASDEFARTRPAFRWRHIVSLARVIASSYGLDEKDNAGHRAPGYEEACRLLGVTS